MHLVFESFHQKCACDPTFNALYCLQEISRNKTQCLNNAHERSYSRWQKTVKWWREREKLYLKSFFELRKGTHIFLYILLCTSIKQAIKLSYTYIADIKVFHVEKSYFSTFLYTRRNFSVLFSCTLTIQLSCSYLNRFSSYIITDDLLIFLTRWHSFHRIFIVTNNVANIKLHLF